MAKSETDHRCYACPTMIRAGTPHHKERQKDKFTKRTCTECHDRRVNTKITKENKQYRNICLLLTLFCFLLFAVDDKYASGFIVAFVLWVFYVVNYCRKKDGKLKKKV